jgi:hypothetical protein
MQAAGQDRITTLAIQLRKNMLSADDLHRELSSLSRNERSALVECLDRMERGPLELEYSRRFA